MDKVRVIGLEFTGTTNVAFLSLETLGFEDMPGWEIWLTNNHDSIELFPRLRELHIKDCPKLIKVSVEELPSLRILQIDRCDGVVLRSLVHVASSITKLEVLSIFGLTYEVWRGVMEYLGAVEEVRMYQCNEISYLWESEVEARKKEEEGNVGSNLLSSLLILDVWHCKNMEGCYCPNSIESLSIGSCTSVTHVSFPTTPTGGHKLKSLDISLCNKHMEKINNTSMPMLEYVFINCWTNLRSITELGNFIHVTHLEVYGCPRIESFPDIELSKLISLQFLLIEKCPSMDYSFPRGLWPPKLVSLGIGGLRKPISEWGSQNFPASLVSLTLCGESQVTNFNQLSHLLPSSLTQLGIEEFDNLESLSVGLQHLTSLQHLFIEKCPMMKHLPKSLLPSLLSLIIQECPYLEERCNGRGSHYWPLISHIPRIEIECSKETAYEETEFVVYSKMQLMKKQHLCFLIRQPILCGSKATKMGAVPRPTGRSGPVTKTLVLSVWRNPISEWGHLDFPTSLVNLWICGEPHLSNFSQLSDLFPSSLTELRINGFDKLKSLSMGLQHLTSLQHLTIWYCPKMIHLPETLLPSLLSLEVYKCTNLSERCNGRGSHYWPLISHIPRIKIDDIEYIYCWNSLSIINRLVGLKEERYSVVFSWRQAGRQAAYVGTNSHKYTLTCKGDG
ncbi:hypothetical protein M8C21_002491, partial [Ambrosia artemisiifolia]